MKKMASMVIVALLLATTLQIGLGPAEVGVVSARTIEGSSVEYVPHNPIRINNDTDFANQAASEGWNGSGTQTDPYIIENYDIDAQGGGNAIYIGNTTAYFTVRNCYLHNTSYRSYPYYAGAGITFYNVENGTAYNNTVSANYYGIYLYYSAFNTVSGNSLSNNTGNGIHLDNSNTNTVLGNIISNNTQYGLYIDRSTKDTLFNNTFTGDGLFIRGEDLNHWNTHTISTNNTVNGGALYYWKNTTAGTVPTGAGEVVLANCSNVMVDNQSINSADAGIVMGFSSGNTVRNNNLSGNGWYGIYTYKSNNNILDNNTLTSNGEDGIYLDVSDGNSISNSTVESNGYGVYIYGNSTTLTEDIISHNSKSGVYVLGYLFAPVNNSITDSTISYNMEEGVYFDGGNSNLVSGNTIYHNNHSGIFLSNSDNNNISNNSLSYSNISGIEIRDSTDNVLENNTITHNKQYGIYGYYATSNKIRNNNVSNNSDAGIYMEFYNKHNEISGNTVCFNNNTAGIYLYYSSDFNTIYGNNISENNGHGIFLELCHNTTISGNTVDVYDIHNDTDIYLKSSPGCNITGNRVLKAYAGIELDHSSSAIVSDNTAEGNSIAGIDILYSSYCTINRNSVSNTSDGMGIYVSFSSNDTLQSNIIFSSVVGIKIYSSNNLTINNNNISKSTTNIFLQLSENNTVKDNIAKYGVNGIDLSDTSNNNTLSNNTVIGNSHRGIGTFYSDWNTIIGNTVSNNGNGIYIDNSSHNVIYHNNIINNTNQSYDNSANTWDNGYPSGGNYWSDYTGYDNYSGVNQDQPGSDGIGDTAYSIPGGTNVDSYPLMAKVGTEPHVLSTSPASDENNVGCDANVVVVFNESMDSSHTPMLNQTAGTAVGYTFVGWSTTYVVNDTATWAHENWTDSQTISLKITDYRSLKGNYGRPYQWSFTTGDFTAPGVSSTDPIDSDAGVPLGTNVTVVFDESLNTSVTPQLTEITSSGVTYTFAGFTTTNVENDTTIWTHDAWPEKYTVNLKVTGAQDTSGNTMTSAYYWNFTTADLTVPTVISTIPSDGETDVNKSVVITVVFSEEMDTSYNDGEPSLWVQDGADPGGWTFLGWSSTNVANDTASWSHNNFTEKDKITMHVAYYSDLAGNVDYYGYAWTFYIEDTHAPYVNSTTPANREENVNETINVTVVFSESMNTSMTPVLTQISGTSVNYTFAGWSTTYEVNDTATWTHEQWADKDSISLEVSNYSDPAGNIGANYTWSFTVRDYVKPSVISTDPQDGAQYVALDKVITVVFSESLNSSVIPSITQTGGTVVAYTFLGWSSTNVANDTAMWSHDNWSEKDQITIRISGYRDLAGNLGDDYYFSFLSADLTSPTIISYLLTPRDGATQVPYTQNVSVVFNETMDTSKTPVLIQAGGDVVNYTFAGWYSTNVVNDTAVWTHESWTDSDTVTLTVSDYYDPAGNMGNNYSWSFRVYDTTPPTISSSSPYDGEINVSITLSHVYVNFSEPMDPYQNTPELYIDADSGIAPQSSFWKWIDSERTGLIFNLTGNFSESDRVRMWLSPMQDPYNNNLVGDTWYFYTYDPVPPAVTDTNPWNGESPPDIVIKNQTVMVYFKTSDYLNQSVIPVITQKNADPGGWTFLGWSEDQYERTIASWSHNNWTTETVNLTVSHYRDMCGNWGKPYSWEFTVSLYNSHAMIRINSNLEMENMAASENWTGNGTAGNPYRIEWYQIDGDGPNGGYCIYIGNTTDYFVIANNSLNYAYNDTPVYPYYPKACIVLYNVINGRVENNKMNVQSDFGVYALETQNVMVSGNYIHDYWWNGMNIENSTMSFFNNTLIGAGNGMYLKNSPSCYGSGNVLEGQDSNTGITLENSSYAELTWNSIVNYSYGIVFDPDDGTDVNITLENNSMENCGLMIWGWLYEHWASHKIVNNTVNHRPLVFLNGVDNYEVNYTIQAGQVYLVDCHNVSVTAQFLVRATVGIYVATSSAVTITNTTMGYNEYGIYMVGSIGNLIWHNNFVGNFNQAYDDGDDGDNRWNATYYDGGGNYWDDHTSPDNMAGPDQNLPSSDGIVDNPYNINGGSSVDNYPLVKPTPIVLGYTPGWHMVAFPWLINPTPITDALANASWDKAMIYLNGTWYTYDTNRPAIFNAGFPKIDRTMGLWVNFTDNSTLTGDSPIHTGNITIYVHGGWNLIEGGLPFLIGEVFSGVNHSYVQSANLTNSSDMEELGDDDTMLAGIGYWVYVDSDYTIVINTDDFTISTHKGIVPTASGQNNILESAPNSPSSTSEISPVQNTQQHYQNHGFTIMLIIAALGALLSTTYWIIKRRN